MSELIRSFSARDPGGSEVTIEGYADRIRIPRRSGRREKLGRITLQTGDGETVTRIEKGRYEVVNSGVVLVSDDPNAL